MAIVCDEDKPVDLLFNIVGGNVAKPHRLNVWNAFQSWSAEHGEIRREDDGKNFLLLDDSKLYYPDMIVFSVKHGV